MGMTFRYRAVIVKQPGGFWARIPGVKGVYGAGKTEASAKKDLQAALQLYLEVRRDAKDLPPPHRRIAPKAEVTATV
ncbi:MAG: type II toxin-antitoxin system HicB family antitoxin [Elusimicrobia bacterium]|nr:type II toxin-antitoxin system HicB family antitoxin [Elusimicrobiota bacterium]